jgi:hypothetical protein
MTTNSVNRNVIIITAGAALTCLCLCVLFVAGIFIFRTSQEKVISTTYYNWDKQATVAPTVKTRPTTAPSKTPRPTQPPVPTRTPVPTEALAPTQAEPTRTPVRATQAPATEPPTTEAPTPTRRPTSVLPSAWSSSMDEIQQQMIDLRGLQPSGTFSRDVLTPDELRQNVLRDFMEDNTPEDMRNDVAVLSTLGLLEAGFDLDTFYTDLLSEQIAGYYDNETKEMYVVGEKFGGMERLTYSHEYVHALQDQTYDIKDGLQYDTDPCEQDSERCAGVQALLEGDASLAQMNWFTQYGTAEDYTDVMAFYASFASPVYDRAPEYMKEDFMFPYQAGQAFVEHLYNQGGWEAVDAAYRDVPVSTEQIMHPEKYPADTPLAVELDDFSAILGDGWEEIDRGVMGEWYTYLILAKGIEASFRLDDDTASAAAEGWGGDAYAACYNAQSGESVFVLSNEWDSLSDADEFASALVQYGRQRFGQPETSAADQTTWAYAGGYAIFRQAGQATVWVMAPNQAAAEAVWAVVAP